MRTTNSAYHVGDCVKVKAGVQDPDFGMNIGGWQGRISGIDKVGATWFISIQWDSITLKNMPAGTIEQCEERGLDWAEMGLSAHEVEPAQLRDKDEDVAKIKKQLSNEYGWVGLGEEGKRIQKVLAGVDQDDEMKAQRAWGKHLGEKPTFPFEAEVAEAQERGPLRGGDQIVVTGLSGVTDDLYGIIVDLRVGRRKYAHPLCDLEVMNKDSTNHQLVKDYAVWFANR